jgi:elongation factor 3
MFLISLVVDVLFASQVRAFGDAALKTLLKSGASSEGPPVVPRDFERETSEALSTLRTLLPTDVAAVAGISSNVLSGSHTSQGDLFGGSLEFQATLVADLVHARKFHDKATWDRCVGVYMAIWTDMETGTAFSEVVRSHYHAIDQAGHKLCFLSICSHLSH